MERCNALIMGVVNITPDSFSDGGQFQSPVDALKRCEELIADGVDVIDLGAESTKPGSTGISAAEEWQRLEPVLTRLSDLIKGSKVKISVDTQKAEIALKAAELGIHLINNVAGLFSDEVLRKLSAEKGLGYICMHMHENPKTMHLNPLKGEQGVAMVADFFKLSHSVLVRAGFSQERIYMDPGIGFGKDDSANLQVLAKTSDFSRDYQMCIGVSRKSFIGRLLNIETPTDREPASKMLELGQIFMGAKMIRTHDVKSLIKCRSLLN